MPDAQVIDICRHTLLEVLLLAAPILAIAVAVSLLVNVVQGADFAAGSHAFVGAAAYGGSSGSVLHDAVDVAADRSIHREPVVRLSPVREIGQSMELSLTELLTGPLVIGVRISGLMLFAPFFGNGAIPPRIKAILVILITAVLYPAYSAQVGIVTLAQWPGVVAREFVLGVAIGVVTNFVFEAAQLAGAVLGVQMGYSLVNILDPQTQVDTTVVAMFTSQWHFCFFCNWTYTTGSFAVSPTVLNIFLPARST